MPKLPKGWEGRLEVGDVIKVHNPLADPEKMLYPVLRIEGNKAFTKFRNFHVRIYYGYVYEYGKRENPIYNNRYEVEKKHA